MSVLFRSIAILAMAVTAAAQTPDVVVKVQKQGNAQAQLEYGKRLTWTLAAARTAKEKHIAVAHAAANLMAVERGWPDQRVAIIEANALLAMLYFNGGMPRNAIDAAERGLALAPRDHRLHVAAARSYARLGDKSAAADAFRKAVANFDGAGRDKMESLSGMNAAATFFEREKQHGDAAAALRNAASVPGVTRTNRVTLRIRALEQAMLASDREGARHDLALLREAHRDALRDNSSPGHQQLLRIAENTIARFETLLR